MNQHWYHCHTCLMLRGVGVCSICARVCHKGHDLSYSKYGNFFCDCGEKGEGSCQALVKRVPHTLSQNTGNSIRSSNMSVSPQTHLKQVNFDFELSKKMTEIKSLLENNNVNKCYFEKNFKNFQST